MEFITNYWVILLVAFILFLLVVLSYLIDKEIRKMKDNDEDVSEIEDTNEKEVYVNKVEESNKSSVVEDIGVNDGVICDDEDVIDDSRELDYDELDIEDIDDDFNKVIHKRKLIDESIMNSVEAMHVDDINIDNSQFDTNIELPEIKIKKDMNEDIW